MLGTHTRRALQPLDLDLRYEYGAYHLPARTSAMEMLTRLSVEMKSRTFHYERIFAEAPSNATD